MINTFKIQDKELYLELNKQSNIQELLDAMFVALTFEYGEGEYVINDNLLFVKFYNVKGGWHDRSIKNTFLLHMNYNNDENKVERIVMDTDKIEGKKYQYHSDTMGFDVFPIKIREVISQLAREQ